ncbi:MAG: ATP-grasp domain-containing protein [Acidimicrobiia bacterium]|nr:ATP-grasp domain-containing protein [Acidimicrobiia bacterium]
MPRAAVVLPSTTYRAGDFVSAATSLGVDLVVVSEQPAPFDMGDGYLQIDCSDTEAAAEAIVALGDEVPLDGVVAADDSGVVVAALAGRKLGLHANDPEAAAATRDKLAMRRLLAGSEVPQPRYAAVTAESDPMTSVSTLDFPLVVKPIDRSASQGVIRVDKPEELPETVASIRQIVGDVESTLIAEEYMSGAEVAVEGLVRDGELTVLAVFDKPDTSSGPAFPETIFVTPSRIEAGQLAECERVAQAAVSAIGLEHGPVHIELKIDDSAVRILEVAARSIGGLCSRSLDFGLMGTSLEALIIRNALGMDKPELRRASHASGVLMIPIPSSGTLISVERVDETREIDGVTGVELTAKPGDKLLAPPHGDRYLGFVFARGSSAGAVEAALRKAMDTLQVKVDG